MHKNLTAIGIANNFYKMYSTELLQGSCNSFGSFPDWMRQLNISKP